MIPGIQIAGLCERVKFFRSFYKSTPPQKAVLDATDIRRTKWGRGCGGLHLLDKTAEICYL
jgi:hypothetical protein